MRTFIFSICTLNYMGDDRNIFWICPSPPENDQLGCIQGMMRLHWAAIRSSNRLINQNSYQLRQNSSKIPLYQDQQKIDDTENPGQSKACRHRNVFNERLTRFNRRHRVLYYLLEKGKVRVSIRILTNCARIRPRLHCIKSTEDTHSQA